MKTILVQFSQPEWTRCAVEEACVLARNSDARIIILRLIQMPHASYLGTNIGFQPPTVRERRRLDDYWATAEDYGVELVVQAMKCISSFDALLQAVHDSRADLVFAHFPRCWLPYWHHFQVWRAVQCLGNKLVTLDQPIHAPTDVPLTIDTIIRTPLADSLHRVR